MSKKALFRAFFFLCSGSCDDLCSVGCEVNQCKISGCSGGGNCFNICSGSDCGGHCVGSYSCSGTCHHNVCSGYCLEFSSCANECIFYCGTDCAGGCSGGCSGKKKEDT